MVEALGIIIDRCPKGRPRKKESQTIEKIGCVVLIIPFLIGVNREMVRKLSKI
jgi:hypothetical protein